VTTTAVYYTRLANSDLTCVILQKKWSDLCSLNLYELIDLKFTLIDEQYHTLCRWYTFINFMSIGGPTAWVICKSISILVVNRNAAPRLCWPPIATGLRIRSFGLCIGCHRYLNSVFGSHHRHHSKESLNSMFETIWERVMIDCPHTQSSHIDNANNIFINTTLVRPN